MAPSAEFKRILVPFDGSRDSRKALRTACELSKRLRSRVFILHVYGIPIFASAGVAPIPALDYEAIESAAKYRAKRLLAGGVKIAAREGVKPTSKMIESSSTVEAIVDFVASEKMDLVVMGTRGLTGFKKLLLGSVSSGVLAHAGCPVLVVR